MTMTAAKLGRLMTAMVTPFDAHGDVDVHEAGRVARYLAGEGVEGLVVSGTTGEAPTLSEDEKLALFASVKAAVGSSASVIAGTGNNSTRSSVALTKRAEALGVDGILAVVPYYNKPTQDGLLLHFGALAEATALPIVLYNIPARTGANMLPATVRELARRYPNIVGVKESSGDFAQISAILREREPSFGVWSGDDGLFLPSLAIGADGLVSVAAHVCGRELREMLDAHERGETKRAALLHQALSPLFAALFATTSPIPVKWAMNELGFTCGPCRSPLGAMPEPLVQTLGELLAPYRSRAHAATQAALRG